jgi:DNA-directed RNA polymerase subunit RPC12/RpoP
MDNQYYKCAHCGETFKKGWSDEEAEVELKENFPDLAGEPCLVVCDDCYTKFMREGIR